jgi:hypothetical protein
VKDILIEHNAPTPRLLHPHAQYIYFAAIRAHDGCASINAALCLHIGIGNAWKAFQNLRSGIPLAH